MEEKQDCEQQKKSSSSSTANASGSDMIASSSSVAATPPTSSSSWGVRNGGGENNNNNEPVDEDSTDDYCVYTYKGDSRRNDRLADLPSSFFQFYPPSAALAESQGHNPLGHDALLGESSASGYGGSRFNGGPLPNGSARSNHIHNGLDGNRGGNQNELYSPEMDFLEMDFDPGGNGDDCDNLEDFENESEPEQLSETQTKEEVLTMPLSALTLPDPPQPFMQVGESRATATNTANNTRHVTFETDGRWITVTDRRVEEQPCCSKSINKPVPASDTPRQPSNNASSVVSIRLVKSNTLPEMSARLQSFSEPSASAMVVSTSDDPLIRKISINVPICDAWVWDKKVALEKSKDQIGTSACGATAVFNVMTALGFNNVSPETVNNCVRTRLRAEEADLPEYLFSRACAGATHEDLIAGMHRATDGQVYGRFFPLSPSVSPSTLIKFLLHWIWKGAVPVATLNLQVQPTKPMQNSDTDENKIPDAWHHQMMYGISEEGVHLTNPIQTVPHPDILPQITSPSILLVRRKDVIAHKGERTDLRKLVRHPDPRWNEMNVLGQVSNMLLEEMPIFNGTSVAKRVRSTHVSIPAAYKAGITLFIPTNSEFCQLLKNADEL